MEVLAFASMTLASLCSDGGLLSGVPMLKFIALVFSFMRKGLEDLSSSMKSCQTALEDFVKKNPKFPHVNVKVPPVPSADSVFPDTLLARNFAKGKLKRPADQEGCDGTLSSDDKILVQVECKNYSNGLDTATLESVISRMELGIKVTFLFTSKLNGIWKQDVKFDNHFFRGIGLVEGKMCVLRL